MPADVFLFLLPKVLCGSSSSSSGRSMTLRGAVKRSVAKRSSSIGYIAVQSTKQRQDRKDYTWVGGDRIFHVLILVFVSRGPRGSGTASFKIHSVKSRKNAQHKTSGKMKTGHSRRGKRDVNFDSGQRFPGLLHYNLGLLRGLFSWR